MQYEFEKKNKLNFIKKIDFFIGEKDIKGIDEALIFLTDNSTEHEFDKEFVKFVLGYVGIYKKESKEWVNCYNKIYNID